MAKLPIVATICLFSLVVATHCNDVLYVEGKVYCDTCRASFVTSIFQFFYGVKVRLECRDRTKGVITYSQEDVTNTEGSYKILVQGDREDEICEVFWLSSPRADYVETLPTRDHARVLITTNNGIADKSRYANPLGYFAKHALLDRPKVFKTMGFTADAMVPTDN